ncbi:hypothetical protein [Candidatus Uabimicrobium sp. HlEnr_7]
MKVLFTISCQKNSKRSFFYQKKSVIEILLLSKILQFLAQQ